MDQARILVVDDDPAQLRAIARVLRRSQYQVTLAANGRIGLRLAVQSPPDLILLDVSMPTMSGHEFLRRLRRLQARGRLRTPGGADIPVIFLTALSATHQRVSGLDAGAVDYITKPFDPDELRARVRCHLRHNARQRQALSAARMELLRLEAALDSLREVAAQCHQPLAELDTYMELAEQVRRPKLRRQMLERARRDMRRVAWALARMENRLEGCPLTATQNAGAAPAAGRPIFPS